MPRLPVRDVPAAVLRRFGLPGVVLFAAVLCDVAIIAPAALDDTGPILQELWLLPGIAALTACALWAATRPAAAALTGAAVLLLSSLGYWYGGIVSYTALLDEITFAETVAGLLLVYHVVLALPPLLAACVTSVLVVSTVIAVVVRTDLFRYPQLMGATLFAGTVLLLLAVLVAVLHRQPRQRGAERSATATLLRKQWPLVVVLAALLFLELFYAGSSGIFSLVVLLCSFGAAGTALLAPHSPLWSSGFYSALVVTSGGILRVTDAGSRYAEFEGLPISQIVSGMAVVVFVVRYGPPRRTPWLIALQSAAVAVVVVAHLGPYGRAESFRILFVAAALVLGICVALGMFLRARDSERARAVATAVGDAQTAERMALARELHDVVAHHVTGIVVQAQAARMLAAQNPAVVVDALGQIEQAGTDAMTAMRRLVRSMRGEAPAGASEFSEQATTDLAADLRRLVTNGNHGVPTELELDLDGVGALPPEVARSALRLVQESLTNVGKHAEGVTGAAVALRSTGEWLHLRVSDDGRNSGAAPRGDGDDTSGYGLVGMRERVDLLRGRLVAGPLDKGGWQVEAWLPLAGDTGRRDSE
ncbi:sensor histidine kinase [Saccharomonospora piscinae]|uniref:sensor histidine kinase n=1 Tax=Saccharomonospora piscinae TaxID=687388 RepID=UPI001FCA1F93|nr:histidine kinase [Saccharomonospora piscinae]